MRVDRIVVDSWLSSKRGVVGLLALAAVVGAAGAGMEVLRVGGSSPTSVTLTWTAVGDDGSSGTATTYDL